MRTGQVRLVLLFDLVAAATVGGALLLGLGLPLAAQGRLGPGALAALVALAGVALVSAGAALLFRAVARPVERLLGAAARLEPAAGDLPILAPGEEAGSSLGRAAVAFERTTAALAAERARLAAQVEALERANGALAEARESLVRSEKLATVGRLAAGIAHEVGNPLGAIAGYADLGRDRLARGAPLEADDCLARIGAEAGRIDRIVRDLLDFARPAPLALAPVSLAAAADAAVRLARVQPRFRQVEVVLSLPADLPAVVADEGRLAQVLLNLLLNAGDAMAGKGRLELRAAATEGAIEVAIADEGPGIAPEDLPRVFDPFFTTKAPGAGTGLGLAICHRIVESFGGEISAANGPGGGAIIRLRLARAG